MGGVLYTMTVLGEGFCPLRVVSLGFVPGGEGWFWMKLILALVYVVLLVLVGKKYVSLRLH